MSGTASEKGWRRAWRIAACLGALSAATVRGAAPAAAQVWPNDVRLSQSLDVYYKIDPKWQLNVFGEVREDHNVSHMENALFRPNIQYALSPQWTVAAGYVQFQPLQPPFRPERGPFEDLYFTTELGGFGLLSRLRFNETFADQKSAALVSSSALAALQHSIGNSEWFAVLSDEVYVNLKVDYTGRRAGFQENKTFVGVGRPINTHLTLNGGYELDVVDFSGTAVTVNTFKLALTVKLN